MFLNFVGVNEKFINLNAVALIEDESTEDGAVAVLTTTDGVEIRLENEDAEVIFTKAEELVAATGRFVEQLAGGVKQ